MVGRISNFEIYGDDPEKLAAFYSGLFGWRVEKVEGVSYWRIGIDGDSAALTTGGIAHRPSFGPQGWMNFVEVASLDEALAAVTRLGGTVLKPKTAVPRTAWHAVIADPAGNNCLIWQPDSSAFPPPEPD